MEAVLFIFSCSHKGKSGYSGPSSPGADEISGVSSDPESSTGCRLVDQLPCSDAVTFSVCRPFGISASLRSEKVSSRWTWSDKLSDKLEGYSGGECSKSSLAEPTREDPCDRSGVKMHT